MVALFNNGEAFDATQVEPATGKPEPIPNGEYLAMITDSEEKVTKAGNGSYIALVFSIADGPHKGKKIWHNLNLQNPNLQAVEIAKKQLSAICHAIGNFEPKDSSELHDRVMTIKVKIKNDPKYGASNEIDKISPASGATYTAPPVQQQYQQPQNVAPQQQQAAAPWQQT